MADLAYRTVHAMDPAKARQQLIKTYHQTGSISETARRWHTSRQVVRTWLRRFEAQGLEGLQDLSRRPHSSPRQTAPEIEQMVRDARLATGYGRERLALFLQRQDHQISSHTIRHILRREDPVPRTCRQRQPVYPALWAWEEDEPFSLIQTDLKDIWDKASLGTARWDHLRKKHLPRYQWTASDGRTRLRFLAFSHQKTRTNGIAFLILTLLWLRTCHITTPVIFQTDWGNEFGGDNLTLISQIEHRFLTPLQGHLKRYPMGRKGYNGRVERSHRSDDEEFYRPYLLTMQTSADMLALSSRWLYFYNTLRPHFGVGMERKPPLRVLRSLGYNGPDGIALLPPVLLDPFGSDLLLSCDPETGNDLLATYNREMTLHPARAALTALQHPWMARGGRARSAKPPDFALHRRRRCTPGGRAGRLWHTEWPIPGHRCLTIGRDCAIHIPQPHIVRVQQPPLDMRAATRGKSGARPALSRNCNPASGEAREPGWVLL